MSENRHKSPENMSLKWLGGLIYREQLLELYLVKKTNMNYWRDMHKTRTIQLDARISSIKARKSVSR